jgi:hypothetical protein
MTKKKNALMQLTVNLIKYLFIILFIFTIDSSNAQNFCGKVLDKNNNSPIAFASVYQEGTFNGTYTDENGLFILTLKDQGYLPIIISAMGYYSETVSVDLSVENFIVYLPPKIYEMSEIVVSGDAKKNNRKKNVETFKKEFLGNTWKAKYCEIENIDEILFKYSATSNVLEAFAREPIVINNNALGYKIIYFLDNFNYNTKTTSLQYSGNYYFTSYSTNDIQKQRKYLKRRKNAYLGSRMHLFRALWENKLDSSSFVITDSLGTKLTAGDLVYSTINNDTIDQEKFLINKGSLKIYYKNSGNSSMAIMNQEYELIFFDKRGYFNPKGIIWKGTLARQRIADLLPFEYDP